MRKSAAVLFPRATDAVNGNSANRSFAIRRAAVPTHAVREPSQTMASAIAWLTPRLRLISDRYRSDMRAYWNSMAELALRDVPKLVAGSGDPKDDFHVAA